MDLLENIRLFRRVAELESFSGAARELRATQSTVSRAVAALEESLGVQLFRRSTRRLQLTSEGAKLLSSSQDLLPRVEEMLAAVRGEKLSLKGQLRVAASFTLGRLLLTPLIDGLAKAHPDLKFHFRLSDGYVDLIEENIDVAIRMGHPADSALKSVRIGTARMKLYASPHYLKENGRPASIDELHQHKLVFFTRRNRVPCWEFHEAGEKREFRFEPFFEADGVDMVREAILQGVGISFLPSWMVAEAEANKAVVRILDELCLEEVPVYAVTTARRELSPKQRAFVEFLRAAFDRNPAFSLRAR